MRKAGVILEAEAGETIGEAMHEACMTALREHVNVKFHHTAGRYRVDYNDLICQVQVIEGARVATAGAAEGDHVKVDLSRGLQS